MNGAQSNQRFPFLRHLPDFRCANQLFFDDMSQDTMKSSPRRIGCGGEGVNQYGDQLRDPMARRETLEMVRTYYTIEKLIVRKRIS